MRALRFGHLLTIHMARIVQTIPIRISNNLEPEIEVHQYPVLSRPLQVPPSAAESGKRIRARSKPQAGLYEVHIPADTRADVWNAERAKELGAARAEEDTEERQAIATAAGPSKGKLQEEAPVRRLGEVRMRSEPMPDRAVYMLATVRDGEIHLHPVSRTLQFRPTMTYLDVLQRKMRPKRGGGDSDSDDGPPPDPDEPAVPPPPKTKKKADLDAREVQLTAKKVDDKLQAGMNNLSDVRQEMLARLRTEMSDNWQDWEYCDVEVRTFTSCRWHRLDLTLSCRVRNLRNHSRSSRHSTSSSSRPRARRTAFTATSGWLQPLKILSIDVSVLCIYRHRGTEQTAAVCSKPDLGQTTGKL